MAFVTDNRKKCCHDEKILLALLNIDSFRGRPMKIKAAIGAIALTTSVSVSAAVVPFDTTVVRTLISENYGECMFQPSTAPSSKGLACRDQWITADCAGSLGGSKSLGKTKFDSILLSELTGGTVRVRVDDSKQINGFCFLEQVQTVPSQ